MGEIQIRCQTAAQWAAENPILLEGEPSFATDTLTIKIGDGVTAYANLTGFTPVVASNDPPPPPTGNNMTTINVTAPNAVWDNTFSFGPPDIGQFAHGSPTNPVTDIKPSFGFTRREAITQDTEGGQNAAVYVASIGRNVSTTTVTGQVNALTANAEQYGAGDVVAGYFSAIQSGTPTPRGYAAFALFAASTANSPGSGNSTLGLNTDNSSGSDYPFGTWQPGQQGSIGIDVPAAGSNLSTVGLVFRNNGNKWDTAIAFMPNSTNAASVEDLSSSNVGYYDAGQHTYGIFLNGTYTAAQIIGHGFNIGTTGAYNTASDRTLKDKIKDIGFSAFMKVMRLKPSNYVFKDDKKGKVQAHFIAQDVAPLIPEALGKDMNGKLTLNDSAILAYTVKALQGLTWIVAGMALTIIALVIKLVLK